MIHEKSFFCSLDRVFVLKGSKLDALRPLLWYGSCALPVHYLEDGIVQ